jgi:peptidoglycan/LPS O-acetylase OafA/YrhL
MADEGRTLTFIPAVDGLRAIAIVMVMFHHADQPHTWFDGGRGGVDVFFVISGFLITSLLVNDFDRHGGLNLKRFYSRRAYRLLPAVAVMLVAVVGYASVTAKLAHHPLPRSTAWAAVLALLYVSNWAWAFGAKLPPLLVHLWSLAAEEQFYLLAPIAFALMLPRMTRRAILVALAGAGASLVAWRGVYYAAHAHIRTTLAISRLRFGLDMHADGLIIGCLIGLAFASGMAPRLFGSEASSVRAKQALGVAAILFLVAITFVDQHAWAGAEFWIPLVYALAGAAAVLSVIGVPDGLHIRVLTWPPIKRIGRISYALYLWHLPVEVFTYRAMGLQRPLVERVAVAWIISYALAEGSWWLVETQAQRIRDARAPSAAVANLA